MEFTPGTIKDPIPCAVAGDILGLDSSAIRHRILAGKLNYERMGPLLVVSRKVIEAEAKKNGKNGKKPGPKAA